MKNFDEWNNKKKITDNSKLNLFFKEQEVWWCRTGLNIGIESNGKGTEFARPVLILKKHNMYSCLILSLTTQYKNNVSCYEIDKERHPGVYANLSQIKVVDSKRLISRMFFIRGDNFLKIKEEVKKFNSL
jgi:mRNA interferase MazF